MSATKRLRNENMKKNRAKAAPEVRVAPPHEAAPRPSQVKPDDAAQPVDQVDLASMDSFPCSDPPGYYAMRS